MSEKNTLSELGRAALAYAQRYGWHVIPLYAPTADGACTCDEGVNCETPGKHPRIAAWEKRASTDPAQIRQWWKRWPNANVGIVCGLSKLVVIDLDVTETENGFDTWAELKTKHGFDDAGAIINISGRGQHLIFSNPNGADIGNTWRSLGDGVDTRGNGGQFVAPPSLHYTGKNYAWEATAHPEEMTPAALPAALLGLLMNGNGDKPKRAGPLPERIPQGRRNATLASLAGNIRRPGMSEGAILAALREENALRCDPPLEDDELARIAKSVARYEPHAPKATGQKGQTYILEETKKADLPDCPPLPEEACPDPDVGRDAGMWLDIYSSYAATISPMTPLSFHDSAALWLGSVAIARRLKLPMAFGDVYPNLFITWLAMTTLYRKTTALDVARRLARRVFPHLMAAQDTTPEAFLSDLAGIEPPFYERLTAQDQDDWQAGRNFAAQRGWILDEMSGLLAASGKDYNAGLIEALLRFYECDPYYVRSTRGQGRVVVKEAYLSMLGASTPAAMSYHLTSERLWSMGWWPRFAILTPESRPDWQRAKAADEPKELIETLHYLAYDRLDKPAWPNPPEAKCVELGSGVYDAWERYNKAVSFDLLASDEIDARLYGSYGRLPVQVLKVATIMAALDWPEHLSLPRIELNHLARAISICEEWRASAHRALATIIATEYDRLRVRILRQIGRAGADGITFRNLYKAMKDQKPDTIEDTLSQMVKAGEVIAEDWQNPRGGPKTTRHKLA